MTDIKPEIKVTDLPDPNPTTVLEALEMLGGTADEIAEGLRARGIKGRLSCPQRCVLANYFRSFGWRVDVTTTWLRFRGPERDEYIRTPNHIIDFLIHFDVRGYPDLIG